MDILILSPDNDKTFNFNVHLDLYGNVYFDGSNYNDDPYFTGTQSLIFQLNIDRDNNPYADNGNYDIINSNILINKQKLNGDDSNNVNEDDPNNVNEDDPNNVNEDYIIECDSDDNEIFCEDNLQFIFHHANDDIQINERENGDIAALYDTDIYNNNGLILRAVSGDNSSIYKLRIHLNEIYFKCVTCMENKYKLEINNLGELRFISVI